jgi:hypothetical protein
MRRGGLWADARDKAESILRKTSPADQAAVWTFDRKATPLLTFDEWKATAPAERAALGARKLAETSPGWSATRLGNALIRAAEALSESAGKASALQGQIVLIADLQEGSHLEPLQGYEWPKGIELTLELVNPRRTSNAALQLAADADDNGPATNAGVRVRVSNASDSKREQFKVAWANADGTIAAGAPVEIYVPPGQSRVVAMPTPEDRRLPDRIVLRGDDEDFDNTVFVTPPKTSRLSVLYLGNDSEKDTKQPLYFLHRAFQETRRQSVEVVACAASSPLPSAETNAAPLIIVTDPLGDDRAQVVRDRVLAGQTVLAVPRSASAAPSLARLLGLERVALEEVRPTSYAMLGEIDFRHPLFAPFADPRFSDFTKIHFWKYRRLDASAVSGARVVAAFDNGDPALVEAPVGKGRVLVLASGWQPEESQLALSTKFVPLLYSLLEESGAAAPALARYSVGDVIPLSCDPTTAVGGAFSVRGPDGAQFSLAAGETNFSRALLPGIYTVLGAQSQALSEFAVNLDPTESRTAQLPPAKRRFGSAAETVAVGDCGNGGNVAAGDLACRKNDTGGSARRESHMSRGPQAVSSPTGLTAVLRPLPSLKKNS